MSDPFTLIVGVLIVGLAAARLWKLVAVDFITERPREAVLSRSPSWVRTMTECPWCLGTHLAVILWIVWALVDASHVVIAALAVAHVTGMIGER